MAASPTKFHYVGSVSEVQEKGRKCIKVDGRSIFVIHHQGSIFALDSLCYHAGGPLHLGDIEDVGSISCIVCPWHKYKISLKTGEGLYYAIDPYNLQKPPQLKSKGVKQRTHEVKVDRDEILVALSTSTETGGATIESDSYNCPTQSGNVQNMAS